MASNATDPDESLHLQVRRLSGEVERLREDAERYRWLRSKHRLARTTSDRVEIRLPIFNGEAYLDLDAAIDAAINSQEKQND